MTSGQDPAPGAGRPTRVLLVDDNPDIADVLCHVVGTEPAMECVGCLQSVDRLTEEIRSLRPDVLVLDARMPGKDPLSAMKEFAAEFPDVRTIFHSGFDDPDFIEQIIDAGAWGFVSKTHDPRTLIRAIRSVAAGRVAFVKSGAGSAPPPVRP